MHLDPYRADRLMPRDDTRSTLAEVGEAERTCPVTVDAAASHPMRKPADAPTVLTAQQLIDQFARILAGEAKRKAGIG